MSDITINIKEWEEILPEKGNLLFNRFIEDEGTLQTVEMLNDKGILNIIELKNGIKITTNSYVGKIKIGEIQLNIYPKIEGLPLYRLLKYTYGLRDLNILESAIHDIDCFPFHDLLIYQLYTEVEDLVYRGLNKKYKKNEAELESPRGRIDFNKLIGRSTADSASLPCFHFERSENNELNQVILTGLHLALKLVDDFNLKILLHRLCKNMSEGVHPTKLNRGVLQKTIKSVDRLSERYRPALELINILFESQGIQLENGKSFMKLKGFLFDMNSFFQFLLSKLMKDYLDGVIIRDEFTLHDLFSYTPAFNPQRRYAPKPRPDFALIKGAKVISLLDAKYKDLWETRLPREMLYQLSIYAVSGTGNNKAKILYPSMSPHAKLQKIDIKNPTSGLKHAEVILQPVSLLRVAELIDLQGEERIKGMNYVREIVLG
ncbi:MAG: restriction endonuclease [Candidatus Syntrophonatronum acetioxidans]|uniref:Restriction endonuclease n=1 Tax=Candidatus Syntrophonatronum acetioxidans TaxID=1795816 RepID=A0A424YEF8_9FIRM|nr:MAG: restriction endonuclease [Candidatus Syntrophonatronum acetioxidans]